jgi:hypothetical protein
MLVNVCSSGRAKAQLNKNEINLVTAIANGNTSVSINAQSILASINNSTYERIPQGYRMNNNW